MLSFVDQHTNIKVIRVTHDTDGQVARERLGVVKKKDFALDEHLAALPNDEQSSIAEMVEFYKKGPSYEVLSSLYRLPSVLRLVVEHVVSEGTKFEREMVLTCLVEALRTLRIADRENAR